MLHRETKDIASPAICDPRFGTAGIGIYMLPFGLVACFLSFTAALLAIADSELTSFASTELVAIWILAVLALGFFLMLALGGCRILLQARYVVQRIEGFENIIIRPFLGNEVKIKSANDIIVVPVLPHKPWIPMTLLSRQVGNWKIIVQGKSEYLVNGEVPGAEQWFRKLQASRSDRGYGQQ